jgi:hypothetical protein
MAQKYTPARLVQMARDGTAYKLGDGHTVPTADVQDLAAAITSAKAGFRRGTAEDDAGFRAHLIRRAAALGTRQLIPASWGNPEAAAAQGAGKSRLTQLESIEVERLDGVAHPASGYGVLLAKGVRQLEDAAAQLRRQLGDDGTASAALAKAAHYDRQAAQIADPAAAEGYRELARQARAEAEAGTPGEAVVKAWKYEQQAEQVNDPAVRENYRELARIERERAGL